MSRSTFVLSFLAILGLMLALLSIQIDAPWRYIHDDNGMHYSMFGYNHVVDGPLATRFHNAYRDKQTQEIVGRYLNHPPLLGLVVGAAFWITGHNAYAVARGTAILFHLMTVFATCWLAWRLFDRSRLAALLGIALFALMPISTYFGKTPVYEPVSAGLSMLGVVTHFLAVEAWRNRRPGLPWLLAGLPLWFLAMNADWDAHIFLAGLGAFALYGWFRPDGVPRRVYGGLAIYVAVLSILGLGFTLAHILWVGGEGTFDRVWHGFTVKTGERSAGEHGWYFLFLGPIGAVDQMRRYFTLGPMVLAGIWLWRCATRWRRVPLDIRDRWIFTLFLVIAFFLVVASEGVNQHAYFAYPGQPFVVLAGVAVLLPFIPNLSALWRQRRWLPIGGAALLLVLSAAGAAEMLRFRYATPSGYVQRRVDGWRQRYLTPPEQALPAPTNTPTDPGKGRP